MTRDASLIALLLVMLASSSQGQSVGQLLEELRDDSLENPQSIAKEMAALPPISLNLHLKGIAPLLSHRNADVRYYCLVTLGKAAYADPENGRQLLSLAGQLVGGLRDEDARVREWSAYALAATRPGPPEAAVEPLLDATTDQKPAVRRNAIAALAHVQKFSEESIARIYREWRASSDVPERRSDLTPLLGRLAQDRVDALDHLLRAFQSDDQRVQLAALRAVRRVSDLRERRQDVLESARTLVDDPRTDVSVKTEAWYVLQLKVLQP